MAEEKQEKKQTSEAADNKERNAAASQAQQEKLKNKSNSGLDEESLKQADPKELRKKLSNKNSDYVFRLEKFLLDSENFSMTQVEPAIDQILPEIIVAQRKGIPASTLYQKSPSEKAREIAHPEPKSPEKQSFWLLALDNALLYLALFGVLYGIVQLTSNGKQQQNGSLGLLTLIVMVAALGMAMAYYTNWMVTPKSKRTATWKVVLYGFIALMVLFLWVTFSSLPAIKMINPILNPWAEIIIAAIAFVVRYFVRRKYHIVDPVRQARINQAKKRD